MNIIFGAGVIGEATLYACRAKGIPIEYCIDNRITGNLLGVPIVTQREFFGRYFPEMVEANKGPCVVYLTSPNIQDMIDPLAPYALSWRSCGEVLQNFDVSGIEFQSINGSNQSSSYSIEHVKYLIRTCLHLHANYMDAEKLTVQSLDLIVTERCSMRCRDCSNLMQYYEKPENSELNEMMATIDSMCAKMDEIYEFRLIGGEPFMNKELHLVAEHLTTKPNVQKVSIFTNATIVPKEHQWQSFQHPKVRFFITDYNELSRNIQKLIPELESRGIAYVSEKANGWTDCAVLDKHNRTEEAQKEIFQACCAKNLATLHDGRLYRCPFSANAAKLQAVPDFRDDYVIVRDSTKEDLRRFLRDKPFISACDHCNGRSYGDTVITPAIQTKTPLKYKRYALGVIS